MLLGDSSSFVWVFLFARIIIKLLLLLLYRHENDEDFLTQIVVFDDQKQHDDDMMVTGDGLDLNDHQQVFRAVFDQVCIKEPKALLYVSFLNI